MEKIKNVKSKPDAIDKHVGKNLKAIRQKLGMSQESLASCVDVTFQQIQKYEKGTNRISASRMYRFAEELNIQPNDFFAGLDGVGQEGQTNADFIHSLDSESMTILRIFYAIEDQDIKDGLVTFIKKCFAGK